MSTRCTVNRQQNDTEGGYTNTVGSWYRGTFSVDVWYRVTHRVDGQYRETFSVDVWYRVTHGVDGQ